MRTKSFVSVLLLALGIAVAASVTGQEEPLPSVQTRAMTLDPAIVLAVEPIREVQQPTLADAVRRHDYATFHALYLETKPAEYRTLDELWTWAISDPVGAFYGRDMHDRLSRAYPGYASFIDEYKIIDSNGNVFYPTSETRTFLLQQALARQAPNVQVATAAPRAHAASTTPRVQRASGTPAPSPAVPPTPRRRSNTRVATTTVAKKPVVATTPATSAAPPVVANTPATSVAPAPVANAPATSVAPAPVVTNAPATSVAPPVVASSSEDAAAPKAPAVPPQPARTPNSGILLLVIGLIGVGLLAVILRTPREAQPTSILQPQPPEDNKVEPIRRVSTEEKPTPRATGSHG